MDKIMAFITKIRTWLQMNGASVIAALQLVLRSLKELLTALVNLVSIIFPVNSAEAFILKIREFINMLDEKLESLKTKLLGTVIPS